VTILHGRLGAIPTANGVEFGVYAPEASSLTLCLFDHEDREASRSPMRRDRSGIWSVSIDGIGPGQRYGLRADGPHDPERGFRFDPAKLLVDPFATRIDRPFAYSADLAEPRASGIDTAAVVPKSIVETPKTRSQAPARLFASGQLIYELNVRGFTLLHPEIPENIRGTLAALSHPAVIAHFRKIGVSAVELMPVAAWIDERHLPPLSLTNAWGYNPVTLMALDPRLAPGGIEDLANLTASLRAEGIGVILDLVFNHTGESDQHGPILSLRGLCNNQAYRHDARHELVNDTGTGNTIDCQHPFMVRLITDALRHFVLAGGVEGFRFDLATVLGRSAHGFRRNAALLNAINADPVLRDRLLIAEPWDIGPGGYQLGHFPQTFLEWNDRYRDTIRRFWRGDGHMLGKLATALAGSADIFAGESTRSVNFIAAHDGFTLADLVSHVHKHNKANGEENRDGHNENFSWNNGVEGATGDPEIGYRRQRDIAALLSLLFISRGTIMLTAGDEFGRSQQGNNNAYCQDNAITWINWQDRDTGLEKLTARLAQIRRDWPQLTRSGLLTGNPSPGHPFADVEWLSPSGLPLGVEEWEHPQAGTLMMVLAHPDDADGPRLIVAINRDDAELEFQLPARNGHAWHDLVAEIQLAGKLAVPPRSVIIAGEFPAK
jgi:glycogen operon protein